MSDKDDEIMMKLQTIVKSENKSRTEYMASQRKYLVELKRMKAAKQRGEQIDTSSVTKLLQNSGVIDKNGNLNKRYRLEVQQNE